MTEKAAVDEAGTYIAKMGTTTTAAVVKHLAEEKITYSPASVLERLQLQRSITLENGKAEITEEGLKRYSPEKKTK